jgi:hypothetical protein
MGMHLDIAVDGLPPMSTTEHRREQFGRAVEYAVLLGAGGRDRR